MRTFIVALVTLLLLYQQAWACTPAPGWPREVKIDARRVAHEMVEAATYIDVATVVSTEGPFQIFTHAEAAALAAAQSDEERGEIRNRFSLERTDFVDIGRRLTFRVDEHLKGDSPAEFILNGQRLPLPPGMSPSPENAKWKAPLNQLASFLNPLDLEDWTYGGECGLPLFGERGMKFLIFRNAEGKLLYNPISVQLRGEWMTVDGPAYVPVNGKHDPWPGLVKDELAN